LSWSELTSSSSERLKTGAMGYERGAVHRLGKLTPTLPRIAPVRRAAVS
jgi:hypothetical protein